VKLKYDFLKAIKKDENNSKLIGSTELNDLMIFDIEKDKLTLKKVQNVFN
jgi:hypothetical protein